MMAVWVLLAETETAGGRFGTRIGFEGDPDSFAATPSVSRWLPHTYTDPLAVTQQVWC